MNEVSIYILVDPRKPGRVRYVGQTLTPQTRHLQHCGERGTAPKSAWLEQLRADGIMPQMVIVATVAQADANEAEKVWIERFQFSELTNVRHLAGELPERQPAASAIASLEEATPRLDYPNTGRNQGQQV